MSNLNATELAARLDVSKARISQYVSEGKLDGCYTGEGRARRFDIEKVSAALGRRLDPGQMMGNGSETRKALRNIEAGEAPAPRAQKSDAPLLPNDPDRYELARILNAEEDARRKRRDNERDEGRWVLAEEVARHTARTMAQEVAQFETALRDGARAVADALGVDFREVRKIMMDQWRAHRAGRSQQLQAESSAAPMTDTETGAQV